MKHAEPERTLVRVPVHLKQFVVEQNYDRYTPIDHAVWRYVMRQNRNYLGQRAHSAYLEGLRTSGIGIERIPNIAEMNESLAQIGWGAVTINGFIPAVAFFDFQAHGILPIACDIRTYDHIAYTPAPDIIHEAAGHAPIIKDEKYRTFLKIFGEIGSKALSSREDYEVYEAIRRLSVVKEDPSATPEEVAQAEADLEQKVAAVTGVSEAAQVSRLYWWTVEYGLIGDLDHPQIYGAGLLSSVGESISCMKDDVKKLPFSLKACIETDFDITKPQPQLFVCKDFDELIEAIREFSKTMAVSVGGTESLIKAQQMGQTSTSVYSSGLQVSGVLSELEFDMQGEAVYLKMSGPTALAVEGKQLPGHGKEYHQEGFGSPIGRLANEATPLELFSDEQLAEKGIILDHTVTLPFASGVEVRGKVSYIQREQGKIVLIGFDECTVRYGEKTLFQAEWGTFDMAVGEKIISVFAGAADREAFETGTHQPSAVQIKPPVYTEEQKRQHQLYQTVRDIREAPFEEQKSVEGLLQVLSVLEQDYPSDWLLRLEILEILTEHRLLSAVQAKIRHQLQQIAEGDEEAKPLIDNGLALLVVS
ncbi:aromatic amino acid hydroxylase [Brevibacillus humidisoli]|uniref:aromatic amino acid hydroxylase n=1 Tax=Brevibacillus humidisoli TaxID=2895522 RepID=UPI001E534AEE|nr:aromatic amino acid hydroxylase [Brevibacillus humidisoli]UFJ42330.1 aromatic amino acid hydroxylase [Brevibacillus humidisoli]